MLYVAYFKKTQKLGCGIALVLNKAQVAILKVRTGLNTVSKVFKY